MPAPSLLRLSTDMCIYNSRNISNIGDLAYEKIRRVLQKVDNPTQLIEIETNSPQIRGEDAELWKAFIARDIPNWERKNYVPKNPRNWHKVYLRYKTENEEAIKRDEEQLRLTLASIKEHKSTRVSKIVHSSELPKLPRDPKMLSHDGGVPISLRKKAKPKELPSTFNWDTSTRSRNNNPKNVLARARREAAKLTARNRLATLTRDLTSQLPLTAPKGMIMEHEIAARAARQGGGSGGGSNVRRPETGSRSNSAYDAQLDERERRLRAIKNSAATQKPAEIKTTVVDDEDDEDDHYYASGQFHRDRSNSDESAAPLATDADLFGEKKPTARLAAPHKPLLVTPSHRRSGGSNCLAQSKSGSSQLHASPVNRPTGSSASPPLRPVDSNFTLGMKNGKPPGGVVVMKRKPVDIFNRGPKRVKRN